MSKLDNIFNDTLVHTLELRLEEDIPTMKQAVKDLFLEFIGEDMTMDAALSSGSDAGAGHTIGVNSFKRELRAKVESL